MKYNTAFNSVFGILVSAALFCACGNSEPDIIFPEPTPGDNTGTLSENLKVSKVSIANLADFKVPCGNYSGITPIGDNKYAVVDDKAFGAGFVIMEISMNTKTGEITNVKREVPKGTDMSYYPDGNYDWNALQEAGITVNDPEGIVYFPKNKTVFIATEEIHKDPSIVEYTLDGTATGKKLAIPSFVDANKVQEGFGFESLAYNEKTNLFWTTTERALIADKKEGEGTNICRLLSFSGNDFKFQKQYLYRADRGETEGLNFWGVSEMLALEDGRLIIMERFLTASNITNLSSHFNLFVVDPTKAKEGDELSKKLIYTNKGQSEVLANYEGMCLGPKLSNGKQTLLILADVNNKESYSAVLNETIQVLTIE